MNKEQKSTALAELTDNFSKAKATFFADYKGLTVEKLTELRKQLRPLNTKVKVVKNNLARIAVKNAKLGEESEKLLDTVAGPTMVAFAYGDAAAVAKVFHKFSETHEIFGLKDSLLGTKRVATKEIAALAKLPGREVLLSMLLRTMNGPATNFVGVLAAVPRSLVQVLAAIEEKKKTQQV